jgi:hypothetical protein
MAIRDRASSIINYCNLKDSTCLLVGMALLERSGIKLAKDKLSLVS